MIRDTSTYRDPDLKDEDAIRVIHEACQSIQDSALAARLEMLNIGLAAHHPACKWADEIARMAAYIKQNDRIPKDWVKIQP